MAGWLVSEREVKFYKFSRIEAIFFFFLDLDLDLKVKKEKMWFEDDDRGNLL